MWESAPSPPKPHSGKRTSQDLPHDLRDAQERRQLHLLVVVAVNLVRRARRSSSRRLILMVNSSSIRGSCSVKAWSQSSIKRSLISSSMNLSCLVDDQH